MSANAPATTMVKRHQVLRVSGQALFEALQAQGVGGQHELPFFAESGGKNWIWGMGPDS